MFDEVCTKYSLQTFSKMYKSIDRKANTKYTVVTYTSDYLTRVSFKNKFIQTEIGKI